MPVSQSRTRKGAPRCWLLVDQLENVEIVAFSLDICKRTIHGTSKDYIETPDNSGLRCCHMACTAKDTTLLDILLEHDVDLQATTIDGNNILHCAAHTDSIAVMVKLMRLNEPLTGATARRRNVKDKLPLDVAAY